MYLFSPHRGERSVQLKINLLENIEAETPWTLSPVNYDVSMTTVLIHISRPARKRFGCLGTLFPKDEQIVGIRLRDGPAPAPDPSAPPRGDDDRWCEMTVPTVLAGVVDTPPHDVEFYVRYTLRSGRITVEALHSSFDEAETQLLQQIDRMRDYDLYSPYSRITPLLGTTHFGILPCKAGVGKVILGDPTVVEGWWHGGVVFDL